jgi:drug/metabolite transporter (DMT)-like permease
VEYGLALVAAVLLAVGFVLQQRAAEQAPKAHFMRLRLIGDLLRKPWWLVGIAAMVAGQLVTAWVLGHLELSIAEPLLASNLIFALILASPLSRQRATKSERESPPWSWAARRSPPRSRSARSPTGLPRPVPASSPMAWSRRAAAGRASSGRC